MPGIETVPCLSPRWPELAVVFMQWNVKPKIGVGAFLFGQTLQECQRAYPDLRLDDDAERSDATGLAGWCMPTYPDNILYFQHGLLDTISCSDDCWLHGQLLTGITLSEARAIIPSPCDEVEDFERCGDLIQIHYYWHLGLSLYVDAWDRVETVYCYAGE